MQYTLLLSAFAASALAQSSASIDQISLYSVLQTALPSSLVAEALTNPAAASSEIAAEFATATPSWFSALPTDIKTYLVPLATNSAAISSAAGNITAAANATGAMTSMAGNATAISAGQSSILASNMAHNSSVVSMATLGTSSGAGSSASATGSSGSAASASSGSAGSSSSSAAGAIPTAVVGMGMAGVVGIVGLFAL